MNLEKSFWLTPGPKNKKECFIFFIKGFMMGIADVIPGVSGGTIAFITGIYGYLMDALSSINKKFLSYLLKFEFRKSLEVIHIRTLLFIGTGIIFSIITMSHLVHYLLQDFAIQTWSLFFGLILGSTIVLFENEKSLKLIQNIHFIFAGALFAYLIVGLIPVETPEKYWFIYICGFIGITAMILPGISGAFILLMLGKYEFVTGAVKNPFDANNLMIVGIFSLGALTSLLSISKLLNFLLKKYRIAMISVLCGFMLGSLRKLWPYKEVLETKIVRGKTMILREVNVLPNDFNTAVLTSIILVVIGFVGIIYMNKKVKIN